jgi:hypothetical protein
VKYVTVRSWWMLEKKMVSKLTNSSGQKVRNDPAIRMMGQINKMNSLIEQLLDT